jgi:hypothetical protein
MRIGNPKPTSNDLSTVCAPSFRSYLWFWTVWFSCRLSTCWAVSHSEKSQFWGYNHRGHGRAYTWSDRPRFQCRKGGQTHGCQQMLCCTRLLRSIWFRFGCRWGWKSFISRLGCPKFWSIRPHRPTEFLSHWSMEQRSWLVFIVSVFWFGLSFANQTLWVLRLRTLCR